MALVRRLHRARRALVPLRLQRNGARRALVPQRFQRNGELVAPPQVPSVVFAEVLVEALTSLCRRVVGTLCSLGVLSL